MVFSKLKNSPLFPPKEVHHPIHSKIPGPIPFDRPQDPEPLLTPQELAIWLKMSRVWVYKQTEKGALPFHRVGDAIRFDPEEIRSYLRERRDLKRIYPKTHHSKPKNKGVRSIDKKIKKGGELD